MQTIQPDDWPRPSGYANAASASGRVIALAGQIGWNPLTQRIETDDFVEQVEHALTNVVALLKAANADANNVIRLTWYITDRTAYVRNLKRIGEVYREVFGSHYPAMSVVVVAGLLEARAQVEIEATAVLPQ